MHLEEYTNVNSQKSTLRDYFPYDHIWIPL